MFGLGWPELLLIIVVVLLLFGPKRLPEIAKAIGKSVNAFKEGMRHTEDEVKKELDKKDRDS